MPAPVDDRYGELDYGDWEDPWTHLFLTMCDGCPMCIGWPGRTFDQIRAARINLVEGRRLRDRPEPSCKEIAREDRMAELRFGGE